MGNSYTVLLLLPDALWHGHASDWISREHVIASDPDEATKLAVEKCMREAESLGRGEISPDNLSILAIYNGHLFDLYQS